MRKKSKTILTMLLVFTLLIGIMGIPSQAASTNAKARQILKTMKSVKSNSDIGYSVSMKKESGRYVYTMNIKMKKISSGLVLLSTVFAADSMNSVRKTFKKNSKEFYKMLRKAKINGDIIINVKSSDRKLIWKFKNGKQTYCYY